MNEQIDRNYILSIEKAFKILEAFCQPNTEFGLTEIANTCMLSKTATNRFLYTLTKLGYLIRNENKRYLLSPKVMTLGYGYLNASSLRSVGKQFVDELSEEIDRTVNLGILYDINMVYLYRKEVMRYLKHELYDGSLLPAYCTSLGKILLAGLSDEELKERIGRMELKPITSNTITDKEQLYKDILDARQKGFCVSDRELSMDLFAVAVPVLNAKGCVVAGINVTMSPDENSKKEFQKILEKLTLKGCSLSNMLGYIGSYPKLG